MSTSIIIRFRSKKGTLRVSVKQDDDFRVAFDQLAPQINGDIVDLQLLSFSDKPTGPAKPARDFFGHSVASLGLRNGDMLFVSFEEKLKDHLETDPAKNLLLPVFPVDKLREKQDGLIKRSKGTLCGHGDKGMCDYCSPLAPYNKEYHVEHNIKHLSFHAHLKQLLSMRSAGSLYTAPLEQPSYGIDLNCKNGHRPYPDGICSKCQPNPITLQQQKFRMVDHVEFADSSVVNNFIDAWRQTGCERYSIIYGHYKPFDDVPLGIKAVAEAIVEPAQNDEADGIDLSTETSSVVKSSRKNTLASALGLVPVG